MTTLRLLPDLEAELVRLPGIRAASVVTDGAATPTEIHVLADQAKAPKQLVRDVQSLAMAQFDLDIDHRIVSVVQFAADEVRTPDGSDHGSDAAHRPVMTTVGVRTTLGEAEATIILTVEGGEFEGKATGPGTAVGRPRLLARATLEAVRELLGSPAEVEHAAVISAGGRSIAVCVLSVVLPRLGEQLLTGSALVRDDEADAVARSVLDALNRRLAG
jgi:hypothetical protein